MNMENILKEKLSSSKHPEWEERYLHSLGVCEMALLLNEKLGLNLDKEKVYLASILHDFAKFDTLDKYQKLVEKYNLSKKMLKLDKKLCHSFFGPYVVMDELGIFDEEILNAIRYHTTGKENMTTLEEVVFISDFIEKNRIGEIYESVRRVAYVNLKKAVALELDNLVNHLKNIKKDIDSNTLKAYEYYKKYLEN